MTTARAWARLLRISLFPSAVADPIAGAFVAGASSATPPATWAALALAALASLCVYHGAMALNDWRDRERDRAAGRPRPLVLGQLRPGQALAAAATLLALGPLLAWGASHLAGSAHAHWILAGVLAAAVAYDLVGRGPLLGPLLLGLCRAGNLAFGAALLLAPGSGGTAALVPVAAAAYFALLFLIGRLGRMEDGEDAAEVGRRPVVLLLALVAVFFAAVLSLTLGAAGASPRPAAWAPLAAAALALWAVAPLLRWVRRPGAWSRADVERTMGASLSRLVPFVAVLALASARDVLAFGAVALLLVLARIGRALFAIAPPS